MTTIREKIVNRLASMNDRGVIINQQHLDGLAEGVAKLVSRGLPEDRIIEVICQAVFLENPEPYIGKAISDMYGADLT